MEEEAREILKAGIAAKTPTTLDLAQSIRRHLSPFGGVELTIPAREPVRRPPNFAK
jgi:plasmid stability protein